MVENNMQPIKRADLTGRTNETTMNLINSVGHVQMKTRLKELLDERGMTQQELADATGIGKNMISGFVNNRSGVKVGYGHIYAIMIALRITDISEFLIVEFDENTVNKFETERTNWIATKTAPTEIRNLYM